ncbi:19946_t:CDS:1, partial [Racocetra persica]
TCTECKTSRAKKKIYEKVADTNIKEAPIEIIIIDKISDYISNMINGLEYDTALFSTFYVKLDKIILNTVGVDVRVIAKLIINKIEKRDDFK